MNQCYPLSGLKVVELATVVAAPATARMLSDYGAYVVKVENYPNGDLLRPTGKGHSLPTEDDHNPLFDLFNAGKKLISLNLKQPEAMEVFHKLLDDADIFITNLRVGSLKRIGLDYDTIKKTYPRLIFAHFSGFGLMGDEVNRPGFDTTAFWMRSGASVDIGTPGNFPIRPSFGFGDLATASGFLASILMAVLGREQTGHGNLVSSSLQKSAIWYNATSIVNAQPQYGKKYPVDRYQPWDPFSDYYLCKDGEYIAFMEKVYSKDRYIFAEIFDMPELTSDEELSSLDRMRDSGKLTEVTKKVQDVMLTKASEDWKAILDAHDVANEIARHFCNVYTDSQAKANHAFDEVEYPGGITTALPTPPFWLTDYDRKPFQKTGAIGRDTVEVLSSLGYTEEAIQKLRDNKILQ